ncbi:ATP-binding protein [Lebetimonas sp. JH292]|uniref:ATP-binding protein n=1 Tax=Lebetimonas sp. JH292 TaxID=990068 RepID=UPI00046552C6|nr:ATP-binding protein [Lebetimonas sp. JH292]
MLSNLINEFEDKINLKDYFSYVNFEIIKESVLFSKSNIIFLLGEPGSGKSFLLNYLYKNFNDYILINEAFESKEEFFKLAGNIENKRLLIDEAQLLDIKILEFLRTLSDKGNQVVFAMHKIEGEKIAKLPQFFSRYNEKIYLKPLNFEEFQKYTMSKFIKNNKPELIDEKILKKIYNLSGGNFRLCKKIVFTALDLLNFSLKNSLKYRKIDNCILTMSAIKLELK